MGLTNTIQKAVDTVFLKVGDLKTTAILTQKNVSGWDVAAGTPMETVSNTTVDVIVLTEDTGEQGVILVDLIFKTSQFAVDTSTSAVINGANYTLIPPFKDNGFIVEVKAKKEQ